MHTVDPCCLLLLYAGVCIYLSEIFLFPEGGLHCYKRLSQNCFAGPRGFWIAVLSLSFASIYFLIASLISSEVHWYLLTYCLASTYLCFFQFFFLVIDFWAHNLVLGKDAWYHFNFLEFTEAWLVAQYVIYPGEYSVCTEKKVYSAGFGWNVL